MAVDNLARGIAGSKLSQKGGTITGNLEVTGDLNVRGTTITTKQETLMIKDNIIVTNADGKTLQGVSGIAIRSGSSVVYGLVYDPVSDTVKFGMGSLDSHNNFTFNTNEGLPIAVRADSSLFVDGHYVKWDATHYCFVDGGSVSDIPNQKPFNPNWTTSSFTALIASIYADTKVVAGDVYIGTVYGGTTGGMPFDGNAEVRIEINTANRGVMHCEITSSNVAPYHWECQVVAGTIYDWRSWVLTAPDGTNNLLNNSNKINSVYLDVDTTPTQDSTKLITSGAVYSAMSGAGGGQNPNLLINSNFSVNQRGATRYTIGTTYSYTVDCWKVTQKGSDANVKRVSVYDNYINIEGAQGYQNRTTFLQETENAQYLSGKTVSFSISALSVSSTYVRYEMSILYKISSSPDWVTLALGGAYTSAKVQKLSNKTLPNNIIAVAVEVDVYGNYGVQNVSIDWAKLEVGETCTDYTPPLIAEELLKCQRYYQLFGENTTLPSSLVDYRPTMRTTPTTGTIVIDGITYQYADASPY